MRVAAILALGLVLAVMGFEIARFVGEGNRAREALSAAEEKLSQAKEETAALEADIYFYNRPENLEKEMRARFNYRAKGEKLLILVPKETSTLAQ